MAVGGGVTTTDGSTFSSCLILLRLLRGLEATTSIFGDGVFFLPVQFSAKLVTAFRSSD